jgi:hypothetical protein
MYVYVCIYVCAHTHTHTHILYTYNISVYVHIHTKDSLSASPSPMANGTRGGRRRGGGGGGGGGGDTGERQDSASSISVCWTQHSSSTSTCCNTFSNISALVHLPFKVPIGALVNSLYTYVLTHINCAYMEHTQYIYHYLLYTVPISALVHWYLLHNVTT